MNYKDDKEKQDLFTVVAEKGENGDRDRCRRSAVIVISFVYLK